MTNAPIRVLVADDSPTARALLVALLGEAPEITVIGEARDGVEAVQLVKRLRPDLVTMDVRMPRLDGFEATKQIMVEAPTPIVIVSASVDPSDIATSMQALRAGALTVLSKPPGPMSRQFDGERTHFVATIMALAAVKVVRHRAETRRPASTPPPPRTFGPGHTRLVAIGASTGGPAALREVLEALPADFRVPVLIVQHLAHGFLPGFAAWLDQNTKLRVKVAEHGELLLPGTVYLAPEDRHLGVTSASRVAALDCPAVGGFRPSANVTFASAASVFGATTLAVILTGMGRDGVEGLRKVRNVGGRVIAQDASTAVVFGMPGAAVEEGLADVVLPLGHIAPKLRELVTKEKGP